MLALELVHQFLHRLVELALDLGVIHVRGSGLDHVQDRREVRVRVPGVLGLEVPRPDIGGQIDESAGVLARISQQEQHMGGRQLANVLERIGNPDDDVGACPWCIRLHLQ